MPWKNDTVSRWEFQTSKTFTIKIKIKSVCVYTFVYRSTRHVVETQCRVHVIHILQKREKILHFFKRDALINTQEASER